jgi:hypothetical protein
VGGHSIAKLLACAAATSWASLLVNFNDVGRAANHRVDAAGFVLPLMNSITIAAITLSNGNLANVGIVQLASRKRSIAAAAIGTAQAILIERTRPKDDF